MKKLTRKLFVSIMTLVLTAMALGTSTFAWFSSSYQATATGLQVTAKTNAVCLLIDSQSTLATIQSNGQQSVAAFYGNESTNADKKVYPAAYSTTAQTIAEVNIGANSWYTANNGNINASNDAVTAVKAVTEADKDYMLTYQVWLTLAGTPESTSDGYVSETTRKLKVTTSLNTAGTKEYNSALSCVILVDDTASGGATVQRLNILGAANATTANAIKIDSGHTVAVTVYVYINGNDSTVTTKNLIDGYKLTGTLGLQFDLVTE